MPGPLIAAGIIAALGGFMAAKNKDEVRREDEKQKNARELTESILKPMMEQGDVEGINTFEKTAKQHYSADQWKLIQKHTEYNSQANKMKRMAETLAQMQGMTGGTSGQPQTQQAQPQAQPEATAMTGGPSGGSLGPTNPNEQPNVMSALAPMMQQDITGQPSRSPEVQSAEQEQIGKLQALDQSSARYQRALGGGGAAPVQQAQTQPVPRLQPKINATIGSKGEPSINFTPPNEQEQQVHQAQFIGAQEWVMRNPQVQKAYGTQLLTRLRAGDPKALEQVLALQKDPSVQPPVDDVLRLTEITDPKQQMDEAIKAFGDPKKAADFVVQHPPGTQIDVKALHGDIQDEVRALNAKAGKPPQYADEATYRQAQANVLKRASDVRAETSKQTEERLKSMLTARASTNAVLRTSQELTKKLSDDTQFLSKANMAIKYLAQAGDMIYAKGSGATGVRPIDAAMREFQGYLQQGKTGEAAALMQGWSTDIALLEQRFFGASSRMAESIINKQEQNVPNVKDKLSVFNQKLARIHEIFKKSESHLGVRREAAIKMLDSNPYTKPAADAMRQGLYDVSTGFLKNATEAAQQEPVPQVNFGSGEFAPSGGK